MIVTHYQRYVPLLNGWYYINISVREVDRILYFAFVRIKIHLILALQPNENSTELKST